ncbi:MAG: PhoH family protein [Casimicrobiaceae bacterium]|nr:PhoH family protein [Casimicrobiaceae bacterium]
MSLLLSLAPLDNRALAAVCGALDSNLRLVERELGVSIRRRGTDFTLDGDTSAVALARRALERFRYLAVLRGGDLEEEDLHLTLAEIRAAAASALPGEESASAGRTETDQQTGVITLKVKRNDLAARTPTQHAYLRAIQRHDVTFGMGPAGTGKTFLAVACAVDAFEREQIKRIVLVRPAVEAGERLGFLPGDLIQKVDPYLRPLYDALFDLMGYEKTTKLMERGTIEVAPLAFMRGRTLNASFIILDEAQNTTPEQMKMFLTRIGYGTKAVITGDPTQIDLKKGEPSGLLDARRVLAEVPGIAFIDFTAADVVRHPLVAKIVNAYERQPR